MEQIVALHKSNFWKIQKLLQCTTVHCSSFWIFGHSVLKPWKNVRHYQIGYYTLVYKWDHIHPTHTPKKSNYGLDIFIKRGLTSVRAVAERILCVMSTSRIFGPSAGWREIFGFETRLVLENMFSTGTKMNSIPDKLQLPYWGQKNYCHDSPKKQLSSLQTWKVRYCLISPVVASTAEYCNSTKSFSCNYFCVDIRSVVMLSSLA